MINVEECKKISVKIASIQNGEIPVYKTDGASGADLYANEEKVIQPKDVCLIKTGIKIELPKNFEAQVRSRSGLAIKNKVFILNSPGTIDSDYTGEICVIMANFGDSPFLVAKGMRIAQLVLAQRYSFDFKKEEDIFSKTKRGENGFGHTGV